MQVESTTKDGVAVIAPSGVIDTRSSMAFESALVQAFSAGTRRFAVDFTRVDLVTSAGIRVLVMVVHRLRGAGGIALFGLSDRVRTVFEIGGLLQQFTVKATEAEALAHLAQQAEAPAVSKESPPSRLSTLVLDLVGRDVVVRATARAAEPGSESPLTATVKAALDQWTPPSTS